MILRVIKKARNWQTQCLKVHLSERPFALSHSRVWTFNSLNPDSAGAPEPTHHHWPIVQWSIVHSSETLLFSSKGSPIPIKIDGGHLNF